MTKHPFAYLADVAAKYGRDEVQVRHVQEKIIESLGAHELTELAGAYRAIEANSDSKSLTRWIRDRTEDGLNKQRNQMRMLFFLFDGLGRRGIPPFNSYTVGFAEDDVVLDWNKLPAELKYLAKPAETYGKYEYPEQVLTFLRNCSPHEIEELRELTRRVKEDSNKIDEFLV